MRNEWRKSFALWGKVVSDAGIRVGLLDHRPPKGPYGTYTIKKFEEVV